MSTRSATNKRTQNHEYAGVSRRSAASAKPAREAAGSVRVVRSTSKARRDDRIYAASSIMLKADPDYKRRRMIFWLLTGAGLLLIISAALMMQGAGDAAVTTPQIVVIVVSYALVIGAFIFDWVRIRPLRNAYQAKAGGMTDAKLIAFIEADAVREEESRANKGKKEAEDAPAPAEPEAPRRKRPKKNNRSRR